MKVWIKRGLFLLISLLILVIVSGVLFSNYVEDKVTEKIIERKGTIASVHINLLTRSMHLKGLEWYAPVDSSNVYPYRVIVKDIQVRGIHILALLRHKKLVVNKLLFDDGIVDLNTRLAKNLPKNSTPDSTFVSFKAITFSRIAVRIQDSTATYTGLLNCELTNAIMKSDSIVHVSVKAVDAKVRNVRVEYKGGMYSGAISEVYVNSTKGRVVIDSVLLTPMYGRDDFATVAGNQVARVNLSIPRLTIEGLQFQELLNRSFIAAKIDVQSFDLFSYKDKRIPFVREENRLMPMESFLNLPYSIKVDSIIIGSSHIAIEEFPAGSTTSGIMTFDNVKATFGGLNNRLTKDSSAYAVLKATGLLMNNGSIQATFQFPLDGSATYTARGSISNMELISLNPVLENMVDLRIKTGYLSSLTFNFNYTDFTSKGVLNVAYQDLNISGLDKNKSTINEFKTFLIQVFTKRDKLKAEPTSNRVGVIDIERDRKRFIFNVWWKSLVDGLKSSMGGNQKRNREKRKSDAALAS